VSGAENRDVLGASLTAGPGSTVRFGTGAESALRSRIVDQEEVKLISPLVACGALPSDRAEAALLAWQKLHKAGKPVSLFAVMVKLGLLTRTQVAVLRGSPLEVMQPFPSYRLLRKVGEGGMALVYEATYLPLDARVALKILKTEFTLQKTYRLRFKREAAILQHLEHGNIVDWREYSSEDGVDYCAMGFVDGISALDILDGGGALDEGLALHVCAQVADALEHMRENGVVHRDLKPDNFVIDPAGRVKIIDFGLARLTTGMREDTREETTVGTVEYMSPEQCRGSNVDIRSDIYSLGVSLFQMITGDLPFTGTQVEVMSGHVQKGLSFSAKQTAAISPPVQFVLRKTMAKDPTDRYATPQEMFDDLHRLAGDLMVARGPVPELVTTATVEDAPIEQDADPAPISRGPVLKSARAREAERAKGDSAGTARPRRRPRAGRRRRR